MSLSTVLERVTTRRAKAEQKTINDYRQLVVALADDADVDAARVDALLLDAARTPAQLAADVEKLRQRRADVEAIAPLEQLRERRDALAKLQVSLREALRQAEVKYREDNANAQRELNALDNQIRDLEARVVRLRAGRPDPREVGLRAERNELQRQRDNLRNELGPEGQTAHGLIGAMLSRKKALAAGPQPHVGEFPGSLAPSIIAGLPYDEVKLKAEIDLAELRVRDAQGQMKKIENRLAEVSAALAGIETRQLTA